MKQYFLMKAQKADVRKIKPGSKWSIKYDGERAFWDGGITAGRTDVPWARGKQATGLWTINANPIFAPKWFTDKLPQGIPCDGELWAGVGGHAIVRSTCAKHVPVDWEWKRIEFKIFEPVALGDIFYPREIDTNTCQLVITSEIVNYMRSFDIPFYQKGEVETIEQVPFKSLNEIPFNDLIEQGHEGICIRVPGPWNTSRSWNLMKLKPFLDSEATIIGFTGGDRGFTGMIGALVLSWQGKEFQLSSGLTHEHRQVANPEDAIPGKQFIPITDQFALGQVVTFKYRELTSHGVPKEARYWRKYEDI